MKTCSIDGCGKPNLARGWCSAHWSRWKRNGDPLAAKPREDGAAQRYLRDVVLPYDGDDCLNWPFARNAQGRAVVHREGQARLVQRLVCEHAHGKPPTPKHEAAHSCGKGHEGCVSKRHLRWATHAENMADTLIHGTRAFGERCGSTKLTVSDVMAIRSLGQDSPSSVVAEQFGMSPRQVRDIVRGSAWAWLGEAG